MTPRKQLFRHAPPDVYGDCRRTALACLLDLDPAEVPHFAPKFWDKPEEWTRAENEWLRSRGYATVSVVFDGSLTVREVLLSQSGVNRDRYYLLGGRSKNGVNHSVVCCSDEIVCDPAQDDSSIVGPSSDGFYWVEWLVPISMVRAA